MKSVVEMFLELDGVRHTKYYANKVYDEHPYKGSLFAFVDVLADYSIRAKGIRIESKDLRMLSIPCIVRSVRGSGEFEFVVVSDIQEKSVLLITGNERKWCSMSKFRKDWTGEAVVVLDDGMAEEPEYKKNKRIERLQNYNEVINVGMLMFCISYAYAYLEFYGFLCTVFCVIGLLSCVLLIGKRGNGSMGNGIVDKLCSWRNPNGCRVKMDEKNALLEYYPLEVWGFAYFVTKVFFLLFVCDVSVAIVDAFASCCSIACVGVMLYRRELCFLCMSVHASVFAIAVCDVCFGLSLYNLHWKVMLAFITLILFFASIGRLCVSYQIVNNRLLYAITTINRMMMDKRYLLCRVKQGKHVDIPFSSMHIWGEEKTAKVKLSVLSNPNCQPCARVHKQIDRLLKLYGNEMSVQYIFSSFGQDYDIYRRFLIAVFLNNKKETACEIMSKWFSAKENEIDDFIQRYKYQLDSEEINQILHEQDEWINKNGLYSTPTIFINGYAWPSDVSILSLRYMLAK